MSLFLICRPEDNDGGGLYDEDQTEDEDGDGRVSDVEYLKWIDIELPGEGWIMPLKYNHPDLGEIWIGGTWKKHSRR